MKRRFSSQLAVVALSGALVLAPVTSAVAADRGTNSAVVALSSFGQTDPNNPYRGDMVRDDDYVNRAQFARNEASKERDVWPWVISALLGLLAPLLLLTHRKQHNDHRHDYQYGYVAPQTYSVDNGVEY